MGQLATASFGITLAHHSVPLAITLENLWEAEAEAKAHDDGNGNSKDAVQVRVLYGNGNILKATAKFSVFATWQNLLHLNLESSIYEQAATLWSQHPIPSPDAIDPWVSFFVSRRDELKQDETVQEQFKQSFSKFLSTLWENHPEDTLDEAITNWLKLAAFESAIAHH